MFRWGVLSTAAIGIRCVIPQIQDSINGVVTALASRDETKARQVAARFGIPHAFGSYEALLESDLIDGVYIPLPTSEHVAWTLKAAEAGKHVLCEKPIALDAGEITRLIEARERHGVLISEAFMVFYHPQWHTIRSLIAEGTIGRLRQVQGAFCYFNDDPANMRNQPALGGGGIRDIGVYPLVTTRIATGAEPRRVQARIDIDPVFGTDSYASVTADFGDFELSFYCATQMALRQHMVFHGDTGFIEVAAPFNAGDYDHARITLNNRDHSQAQILRFPDVRQYRLECEHFVRAARGEETPVFTLENSLGNQRAIDAIFQAGAAGDWVAVEGTGA
ncbi:MAG: Gfo/Idh/MocA family oxidoreductase [Azospirillaceae bacterium]|nr:Gfo/Idh/MocA family oxidoreductase [Azospirillaceae bacterium]